jgi:hypothetical protein
MVGLAVPMETPLLARFHDPFFSVEDVSRQVPILPHDLRTREFRIV